MKKGFTLIEMLVVIGIIAILLGAATASFSKSMKSADEAKAQELVSQAATALNALYEAEGLWPKKIREANKDEELARLNKDIALILAKRGYLALSMNGTSETATKLVGRDRYGVLTPWRAKKLESDTDASAEKYKESALSFAVDLNGDGVITQEECGNRTGDEIIRATAVVWCPTKDGKKSTKGDTKIKSWTTGQTRKVN